MILLSQTIFGDRGNCFAAAGASILEVSLDSVPPLPEKMDGWLDAWREYLSQFNLGIIWIQYGKGPSPPGYSILTLKGESDPESHAVVCLDGQIVHDPKGRKEEWELKAERLHWYVFTVLNPGLARPIFTDGSKG